MSGWIRTGSWRMKVRVISRTVVKAAIALFIRARQTVPPLERKHQVCHNLKRKHSPSRRILILSKTFHSIRKVRRQLKRDRVDQHLAIFMVAWLRAHTGELKVNEVPRFLSKCSLPLSHHYCNQLQWRAE